MRGQVADLFGGGGDGFGRCVAAGGQLGPVGRLLGVGHAGEGGCRCEARRHGDP